MTIFIETLSHVNLPLAQEKQVCESLEINFLYYLREKVIYFNLIFVSMVGHLHSFLILTMGMLFTQSDPTLGRFQCSERKTALADNPLNKKL